MIQIGLLSDTHGHFDDRIYKFFDDVDEIWHAGDFGSVEVSEKLSAFKPLKGVYGNIDDQAIRYVHPQDQRFDCEGVKVFMTHIGGYPGRYNPRVRKLIDEDTPDLFICGHSHLLMVKKDKKRGLLHLNPGAAGNQGGHLVKTMMIVQISDGKVTKLQGVELGPRGSKPARK
ncbi:MAG: metallophosphoesterase family protein [Planctomycetales bacterium]|nr:metallophosphoesterase family protein [Planctomycetales bacterium]